MTEYFFVFFAADPLLCGHGGWSPGACHGRATAEAAADAW
jgi:hypothetical protein